MSLLSRIVAWAAKLPPDHYRYDPAGPTPAVGGMALGQNSGPQDQRPPEARTDGLAYTRAPLGRDLEVIGPVKAELFVTSSLAHTDFFVSLCDVHPSGRSINIGDGVLCLASGRLMPEAAGGVHLGLNLWPTAYRFQRGPGLRVQVSSEPADPAVSHASAHPSAILLPTREA